MCTTFVKRPVYKSQKQTFLIDLCLKVLYRHRTSKVKKKNWWRLEVRKEILRSINGNLNILAIKLTVYSLYTCVGLGHLLVRQRVPSTQGLLFRRFLKLTFTCWWLDSPVISAWGWSKNFWSEWWRNRKKRQSHKIFLADMSPVIFQNLRLKLWNVTLNCLFCFL